MSGGVSPCYDCKRELKVVGCHSRCPHYSAWAEEQRKIREARNADMVTRSYFKDYHRKARKSAKKK